VADGRLKGNETLSAQMMLTIGKVGLNHKIEGTIELDQPRSLTFDHRVVTGGESHRSSTLWV
jgi:hypothetical protein